jgi:hypothetical protein
VKEVAQAAVLDDSGEIQIALRPHEIVRAREKYRMCTTVPIAD